MREIEVFSAFLPASRQRETRLDSFEVNKVLGALLGTLIFVMAFGFLAEAVYEPIEGRGVGYALPEPELAAGGPAAPQDEPLGIRLAVANAEAGLTAVRKCESCHTFEAGGANKAGPNLYDVVNRLVGSHEGFSYSPGMLEHRDAGDLWTYENLDAFLRRPKSFTPGTKMTFTGVGNAKERADMLAYLQTLSASPIPFPPPEAVAEAVPAGGEVPPPTTTTPSAGTPADGNQPDNAVAPAQPADEPASPPADAPAPAAGAAR